MVKIRLKRIGMKKQPFYRIVSRTSARRDGRFIEEIGTTIRYQPASCRQVGQSTTGSGTGRRQSDTSERCFKERRAVGPCWIWKW